MSQNKISKCLGYGLRKGLFRLRMAQIWIPREHQSHRFVASKSPRCGRWGVLFPGMQQSHRSGPSKSQRCCRCGRLQTWCATATQIQALAHIGPSGAEKCVNHAQEVIRCIELQTHTHAHTLGHPAHRIARTHSHWASRRIELRKACTVGQSVSIIAKTARALGHPAHRSAPTHAHSAARRIEFG